MSHVLDDLDRRLVGALHLRPRAPFDVLGQVLGVDASTVARRWSRLAEDGLVRVVGQVAWSMYSETLPVHLALEIRGTAPHDVVERLRRLPQVQYLAQTSGRSAVFATVHAGSEASTARVLAEVHGLEGVAAVRTMPVLAALNRGAGWDPRLLDEDARARCEALEGGLGRDDADGAAGADDATGGPPGPAPPVPLGEPERGVVEALRQDGRASAASLGRAGGLAPSTAHRVVRRLLDRGWVRPRVEVEPSLLGFATPFVLHVTLRPGEVATAMSDLAALPETRFTTRVAGRTSLLCTGLATDRESLARFVDERVATLGGLQDVEVDIVLAEERRYWMDRRTDGVLGAFAPPPLR